MPQDGPLRYCLTHGDDQYPDHKPHHIMKQKFKPQFFKLTLHGPALRYRRLLLFQSVLRLMSFDLLFLFSRMFQHRPDPPSLLDLLHCLTRWSDSHFHFLPSFHLFLDDSCCPRSPCHQVPLLQVQHMPCCHGLHFRRHLLDYLSPERGFRRLNRLLRLDRLLFHHLLLRLLSFQFLLL